MVRVDGIGGRDTVQLGDFRPLAGVPELLFRDIVKAIALNNAVSARCDRVIRPLLRVVHGGGLGLGVDRYQPDRGLTVFLQADGIVEVADRAALLVAVELLDRAMEVDLGAGNDQVTRFLAPHPGLDFELDLFRPRQAANLHTGEGIVGKEAAPGDLRLRLLLHDGDLAQADNIHALVTAALLEVDLFGVDGEPQLLPFPVEGQPDLVGVRSHETRPPLQEFPA